MAISFFVENIKMPVFSKPLVKQWIKHIIALQKKKLGKVSYIFCSDNQILEINQKYLQHDYFTDIITFDYSEKEILSGDLYISVETVMSNAAKFHTAFSDELLRVMIHGIFHLCGLKDKNPKDKIKMKHAENNALSIYYKYFE